MAVGKRPSFPPRPWRTGHAALSGPVSPRSGGCAVLLTITVFRVEDDGTLTSSLSELYETPTEWPKYVPTAPVVCTIDAGAHDAKLDIQCFKNCQHIRTCRKKNARQGLQDQSFLFSEYLFQSTLEILKLGESDEVQENYIKLDQESVVEPGFQSSSSSSSYLKNPCVS